MALDMKIHNPFSQLCILGQIVDQTADIVSVFMNYLFSLCLINRTDSLKVTSLRLNVFWVFVCDVSGTLLRWWRLICCLEEPGRSQEVTQVVSFVSYETNVSRDTGLLK